MRRLYAHPIILLSILLVVGVSGCGIKGPPVSPGYVKPPAVVDLQYHIVGNQVHLTWSVPSKNAKDNVTIAGAKVLRLKQSLANAPCRDCPQTFTMIQKIPARSGTMQFQDTLDSGFGYYYKIVLYDAGNHDGQESNIVHMENKIPGQ